MKRMLLMLATASLLASPAAAAGERSCKGNACRDVRLVFTQGCWSYRNDTDDPIRGIISAGEPIPFVIDPHAVAWPRGRDGQCLRETYPFTADFTVKRAPRNRQGGR